MTGYLCMAAYMVLVCVGTYAATGNPLPRYRGWFPGGEEDEPEPEPQPEQAARVPSWARP